MKKGRYQTKQKGHGRWIIILLLLLVLLVGILIWLLLKPSPVQAVLPNGNQMESAIEETKNPDSIAIPGYEGIALKADTKQQTIGFPNPAQNSCYFQITLSLEDGTVLWQSELVEPGEISDPIKLSEPLAKGTYANAVLKFDCYTMDGTMTALNGAATKMTIWVS